MVRIRTSPESSFPTHVGVFPRSTPIARQSAGFSTYLKVVLHTRTSQLLFRRHKAPIIFAPASKWGQYGPICVVVHLIGGNGPLRGRMLIQRVPVVAGRMVGSKRQLQPGLMEPVRRVSVDPIPGPIGVVREWHRGAHYAACFSAWAARYWACASTLAAARVSSSSRAVALLEATSLMKRSTARKSSSRNAFFKAILASR